MAENRKPKTENRKSLLRICVPVVEPTISRVRSKYLRAARQGLWTEIRLDYLEKPDLQKLFRTHPGPVIATNRLPAEGGRWQGSEAARRQLLAEAVELGADLVDVELAADPGWRRELWKGRGETRLILSWHDFSGTPESPQLEDILQKMLAAEADVLKIVTLAREPGDNLRTLALIPQALSRGREIIAFCMGTLGKWSRVAAPLLGSFLTFAPFSKKGTSAPGQLTVNEIKRLWKMLRR